MAGLGYCDKCGWITVVLGGACLWCKGAVTEDEESDLDAVDTGCGGCG